MAKRTCGVCGAQGGLLKNVVFQQIRDRDYCGTCAGKYLADAIANVQMTTTGSLDGYRISRYIDIESVEIVIGTGVFSEFGGEVSDFFGARSTAFEQKLQKAKRTALDKLRLLAHEKGGNAVIGIDLDYTEFSNNRIGLIANGTIVETRPE